MKKFASAILVASILLGGCTTQENNVQASTKVSYVYKDVSTKHPAYYHIKSLKTMNILDTIDGKFMPDSPMKRKDLAKLLIKANKLNIDNTDITPLKASDVNSKDSSYKYIQAAVHYGYFKNETKFRPDANVTMAEFSMAITKSFKLKGAYPYTVKGVTSTEYKPYILTMLANEVTIKDETINFNQSGAVKRGDVAIYVNKFLKKMNLKENRRKYASKTTSIDNWDVVNGAIKHTEKKTNNGYAQTKFNPLINQQMMNVMNVLLPQKLTTGLTFMPAQDSTDSSTYSISYLEKLAGLQSGNSYFQYIFFEDTYATVDFSTPNFSKKGTVKLFISPLYKDYSKLKKGTYADSDKLKALKDSLNAMYGTTKGQAVFNSIYPEYVKYIKSDKPLKFKMTKYVQDLRLDIFSYGTGPIVTFSKK
ncbi:S-layer homology domain-containing protein [Gottfriedia solisilvae]|uniref:S-layer homology domain-containing protein n=1 Tax=Gottfriedia solisilvae TaxID=1516104 RepID=UPI003D2F5099